MSFLKGSVIALGILFCCAANSQSCYQSSITKPSPFMGNNDEIFVLDDGTIWQVKYEYEYLYEYLPSVVICPSEGKLIVNGKSLNVQSLSGRSSNSPSDDVIESRIDGEFKGWEGESIYKLTNGQVWQQSSYHYHYHYAFRPAVLIYKRNGVVMIHVDGDNDRDVPVKRLR